MDEINSYREILDNLNLACSTVYLNNKSLVRSSIDKVDYWTDFKDFDNYDHVFS